MGKFNTIKNKILNVALHKTPDDIKDDESLKIGNFSTIKETVKNKILKVALHKTPHNVKTWAINKKIKGYGEMLEFRLDPKNRTLFAKVLLAGESEPLEVSINKYQITDSESPSVVIHEASTNRKWLSALIDSFLIGKEFLVPKDKIALFRELLEA